jgi:small-conductance mechanosensitive channel
LEFLDWTFYGNSLTSWLLALAVAVFVFAALYGLRRFVLRQLRRLGARTRTDVDDIATEAVAATRRWYLGLVAIWAGTMFLALPAPLRDRIETVAALLTLVQIGLWGAAGVRGYVSRYSEAKLADDPASVTTVRALGFLATVFVWVAVGLVGLDNLGIEVTAMVAGLGIGGVAVALAVQNILGDLFASLSIVLDKPFVYGDFIVVGDMSGTVEKVGLKTTRVRSLSGEQLVFSNSDLLQSRIRNYKRMFERRVVFTLGVVYQTSREQVGAIPEMLRAAVESQEGVRFDRAHFKSFAASSLDFEVVYYVLEPDFNTYMDRQQAINLAIMDTFAESGIEFAYPTQTLILERADVPQ